MSRLVVSCVKLQVRLHMVNVIPVTLGIVYTYRTNP
jgi:hypothetical protein